MTIHLNATQEQQLAAMSAANGVNVDDLAQQAIDQFLLYRQGLESAVQAGREAAGRGELVDHADVVARVSSLLSC